MKLANSVPGGRTFNFGQSSAYRSQMYIQLTRVLSPSRFHFASTFYPKYRFLPSFKWPTVRKTNALFRVLEWPIYASFYFGTRKAQALTRKQKCS